MKIVFVHFGKPVPKYLIENIIRTAELFPANECVLISDQKCKEIIEHCKIINTTIDQDFIHAENSLRHPMSFRNKFWMTTYVRLIAIAKYVVLCNEPILHIESDVIISNDFPFSKFSPLKNTIAFPIVSPGFSVASIVYISDKVIANEFLSFLSDELSIDQMTTDMKVLDRFRILNPSKTTILPIGPASKEAFRNATPEHLIAQMEKGIGYFGGLFDAIDIGFYLFGEDPRNNRGFRLLRKLDEDSYLRIKSLAFNYCQKRNFVNISHLGLEVPIFSLHIHSKDLRAFSLGRFSKLCQMRIVEQQNETGREFVLGTFLIQLSQFFIRKLKLIQRNHFFKFRNILN